MNPTEFIFTVTEADGNLILAALSELPFKLSSALIDKLKDQANGQVITAPTAEAQPTPPECTD